MTKSGLGSEYFFHGSPSVNISIIERDSSSFFLATLAPETCVYTVIQTAQFKTIANKKGLSMTSLLAGVPKEGLEPSCLATHAPETCVSTNSTTSV